MADVDQSKDEMDALRELVAAMDETAFERFKDLLMHTHMVWSPKKLRAAYLVRRAKTFHDLAAAASEAFPTLCLNPNHATVLPMYQGHLESPINP